MLQPIATSKHAMLFDTRFLEQACVTPRLIHSLPSALRDTAAYVLLQVHSSRKLNNRFQLKKSNRRTGASFAWTSRLGYPRISCSHFKTWIDLVCRREGKDLIKVKGIRKEKASRVFTGRKSKPASLRSATSPLHPRPRPSSALRPTSDTFSQLHDNLP